MKIKFTDSIKQVSRKNCMKFSFTVYTLKQIRKTKGKLEKKGKLIEKSKHSLSFHC